MADENASDGLELAELISALRRELDRAAQNLIASGQQALLYLEKAEAEIQYVVQRSKEGGAKFSIKVVELGGKLGQTREDTHKLVVTLRPKHGIDVAMAGGTAPGQLPERPPSRDERT